MRILFQNYTSDFTTEPMYMDQCCKQAGIESQIWNSGSVFDVLDSYQPNVLVCHYKYLSQDLFKYLQRNPGKIDLVLNVTGAVQEELNNIDQFMGNFSCPFFFNNYPEVTYDNISTRSGRKIVNILPGADIFLNATDKSIDFHVEAAIISTAKSEGLESIEKKYKTFHRIKFMGGATPDPNYDLPITIMNMANLYEKYNEVVIVDNLNIAFSQIFFDSCLRSKKTIIIVPQDQKVRLNNILARLFNEQSGEISEVVKSQIKRKHTCFNRAARLMSSLGLKDEADKLQKISENP